MAPCRPTPAQNPSAAPVPALPGPIPDQPDQPYYGPQVPACNLGSGWTQLSTSGHEVWLLRDAFSPEALAALHDWHNLHLFKEQHMSRDGRRASGFVCRSAATYNYNHLRGGPLQADTPANEPLVKTIKHIGDSISAAAQGLLRDGPATLTLSGRLQPGRLQSPWSPRPTS